MFDFLKKMLGTGQATGVDAGTAHAMVLAGTAVIVDVRSCAERVAAHIPGSLHAPLETLGPQVGTLARGPTVICQCASGVRGAWATRVLTGWGMRALNLNGGLRAWQGAGLPVNRAR